MPDFSLENEVSGPVCGLDEVGRGPLAGPVVAACVYISEGAYALPFIGDIRDSKKLSKTKLVELDVLIREHFVCGIARVEPEEIDEINILQASLKAMALAMEATGQSFTHALVDGNKLPQLPCPATAVVKGDSKSVSIAAASIIAKVSRDTLMENLHEAHPHYSWDSNAGYPSKAHLAGIDAHGITPHHRKSFAPVRNFIASGSTRNPSKSAV